MDKTEIKKYFGSHHLAEIETMLDETGSLPVDIKLKNPKVTLILAIFLGLFGIDRLYQSGIKVFLCKLGMLLFTLGTWWLVDIGYAVKMTQDVNYNNLLDACSL